MSDRPNDCPLFDDEGAYICPHCGGELQFTKNTFYTIDKVSGKPDIALESAAYDLYCENDCFAAEDLSQEPVGEDAFKIAAEAMGMDFDSVVDVDVTLTQEGR